jgi:membrane protein
MVKATVNAWLDDHASSRAAALAYYGVFSLAPTLLIALTIAGVVLGEEAARGQIHVQLSGVLGDGAALGVEALVASAALSGHNLFPTIVGVVLLTLAASNAFSEMQDALNLFWKVPPRVTSGVRALVMRRVRSVLMVSSTGLVLLVLAVSSAILPSWLNQAVAFLGATVVFAALFKFLPDVHVRWRTLWPGAALTSVLFNLGKVLIAKVLLEGAFAPASGAIGAVAALLAWVYYSALIFFLGAEFTVIFSRTRPRVNE